MYVIKGIVLLIMQHSMQVEGTVVNYKTVYESKRKLAEVSFLFLWFIWRHSPYLRLCTSDGKWRRVWSVGGIIIETGKQSYQEKNLFPVTLCPPQIPHGLIWDRDRTSTVGKPISRNGGWKFGSYRSENTCVSGEVVNRLMVMIVRIVFFFNGSTAPWGPTPPHFSRLHDHTL